MYITVSSLSFSLEFSHLKTVSPSQNICKSYISIWKVWNWKTRVRKSKKFLPPVTWSLRWVLMSLILEFLLDILLLVIYIMWQCFAWLMPFLRPKDSKDETVEEPKPKIFVQESKTFDESEYYLVNRKNAAIFWNKLFLQIAQYKQFWSSKFLNFSRICQNYCYGFKSMYQFAKESNSLLKVLLQLRQKEERLFINVDSTSESDIRKNSKRIK